MEWRYSDALVSYEQASNEMEARVDAMTSGAAEELIWSLEHPPLYTAGTSANDTDLLWHNKFPVYKSPRGGQYTYHGPGQRVAYTMLDLNKRGRDVRAFVRLLEAWVIDALQEFGIEGHIREGRVGVWVERPDKERLRSGEMREDKIAAIGIRLRKWISFHGISVNIDPDLSHYDGIVPCGITQHGVTSFHDLGLPISMTDFDLALKQSFERVF